MPTAEVAPRIKALPAALGITQEKALLLLQDDPTFLLIGSGTLAEGWRELQRAASMCSAMAGADRRLGSNIVEDVSPTL